MDRRITRDARALDSFVTGFARMDATHFTGHVFWRDAPHLHFVVEILIDGEPVGLLRADAFCPQLKSQGLPEDHGFVFLARKQQLSGQHQIEARIANIALPVGLPLDLKLEAPAHSIAPCDRVDWLGGLRLAGFVTARDAAAAGGPKINIHEGGALVARIEPRMWVASPGQDAPAAARFDHALPTHFADGRPHRFVVTDDLGRELEGSPVDVLAFPDSLESMIRQNSGVAAEGIRAEWFDRFLPMSVPFENFPEWLQRFPHTAPALEHEPPVRVVIMESGDADDRLKRLETQQYGNWSATVLAPERDGRFKWQSLMEAVSADAQENSLVVIVRPTATLRDDAISRLAGALADVPAAAAVYGDIAIVDPDNGALPLFFGAFDYERMLEQGYAAAIVAVRADALKIPAGEKAGSICRLLLSFCDGEGAVGGRHIVHVPGVLATIAKAALPSMAEVESATSAHLRMRKVKAHVRPAEGAGLPALHVKRATAPEPVSIVIPTRDRVDLLGACIESIQKTASKRKLDIVIVDNGSAAPETLSYLKAHQRRGHRVVDAPGPFNHSHLNNVGVKAARHDILCLLNNDTEVVDPHWLDELLSRLADPTVGAVSPKLVWPNRMVQHGGIVLGPNFAASDAFNDCSSDDAGYGGLLQVAHEASALTAACLVVRRQDYLAVNGFDAVAFPVLFNDVDFCLRLRAHGKRNVFTPHTSLLHHESASRQRDTGISQKSRFRRELRQLRSRWAHVLANDPLYSPFLNLDPYPFSGLAWPPRLNSVAASTATPKVVAPVISRPVFIST